MEGRGRREGGWGVIDIVTRLTGNTGKYHGFQNMNTEAAEEIVRLRAERDRLREALVEIVRMGPVITGGGCFYVQCDSEGNQIGEQQVDPLGVIGSMVGAASAALEGKPSAKEPTRD